MKLLSPAGDIESLKAAVYNGADEVYLGIDRFNARNNIAGFTLDTLPEAVDFAHLYGVKVNLAINILFRDDELADAVATAVAAYNIGVDYFIVQDMGLIRILSSQYPQLILHASTQMGVHNLQGVQALLPYGIRRVVLARETPLAEVAHIRQNTDIEIEYFVQGALCVSFSGNCYLSERMLDCSGNRGKCKQLCRLPYTLQKDGKTLKQGYLLSAKDFNMLHRLKELATAGVDVLKIEGRARRPSYVAMTTKVYADALRGAVASEDMLRLAFNRLYTAGYLDGNGDIISPYQNHIGVPVGRVDKVNAGKKFNEVFFSSDRVLSPKSVFKLFAGGQEMGSLAAYDLAPLGSGIYRLTTTQRIQKGWDVHLISDAKVEEEALAISTRRPISISIAAAIGSPLTADVSVEDRVFHFEGPVCQPAQTKPISAQDFAQNFDKNPYFEPKLEVTSEPVFLPKSALNGFRREVYEGICAAITSAYRRNLAVQPLPHAHTLAYVQVQVLREAADPLASHLAAVYSPSTYTVADVAQFVARCRDMGVAPYLDAPNFALQADIDLLADIIAHTGVGIVANNLYALSFDTDILVGHGLNTFNNLAAMAYGHPVLDPTSATGILSPYMTLRHCPLRSHLGATCASCPYTQGYRYVMDNGKVLTLVRKKLSTCTFYLV